MALKRESDTNQCQKQAKVSAELYVQIEEQINIRKAILRKESITFADVAKLLRPR